MTEATQDIDTLAKGGRTNIAGFVLRLAARIPFLFIAGRIYGPDLVGRFAIAVVVVGGFFALRHVAVDQAKDDTRELVRLQARLVEAAGLVPGVDITVLDVRRAVGLLSLQLDGQVLDISLAAARAVIVRPDASQIEGSKSSSDASE